jgi:adenylate cyclase
MSRQNPGPLGRVWLYLKAWEWPSTRRPQTGQADAGLRRSIFRKYFAALFAAVVVPLLINGLSEAWFGYEDQQAMLDARLVVEASAAARQIEGFLNDIERQMQWAVQLPWTESVEDHRIDALRVLRQVTAISEMALIDGAGIERLTVSRVRPDVIGSGIDRSADPAVVGARAEQRWYGPVTLNRGSEPYMALAVAGNRKSVGLAIAQINLTLIWDVISAIQIEKAGMAFVIDGSGRLVAHPDIDLVLQGANDVTAARIQALQATVLASGGKPVTAVDVEGHKVLAAMTLISGPDWKVFAELPLSEAYAPIRAALWRTGFLILIGAAFALALAYLMARRMTGPIRQLEEGVARIGAGQFDHRIMISTGDELERLATRFNRMASELGLSQERSERIIRLKRFLSPQVAEIVENSGGGSALDARSADVVVVFCDLRGFTDFSGRVEPEELMQVISEYYAAVGERIERYQATLTHFSGDGLMILLNAPLHCPDNPALRAVRMAEDIQAAVQALTATWRARGHAIGFGIGLAGGVATVGRVGYEGRSDYTAIGAVVNLASRLCSAAADGQILIDAATATAVMSTVALEPLGARPLKGFAMPVSIYAVPNSPVPATSS